MFIVSVEQNERSNSKLDALPAYFLEIIDEMITVFIDTDDPYNCLNNELLLEIAGSNIVFYNRLTGGNLSAYNYIQEHIFEHYDTR